MTIVIADPDSHFRNRLKHQLEKITGVHVVGEAEQAGETTAMIYNRMPDAAIINDQLQGGSGIEVLRHVTQLMAPPTVLMITDNPSRDHKNACSIAGADFFFDKATEERKIVNTVRLLNVPQSHIEGINSPFAALDD